MGSLVRLFGYLSRYRGPLFLSIGLMLCATAFTLVQPRIVQWTIDAGIGEQDARTVVRGTLLIVTAALAGGTLHLLSGILIAQASQGMGYEIRNAVFQSILEMSFSNLDAHRTGELIVRNTSDVTTVRMFVRMGFMMMLQSIATLSGSLVFMFDMNVSLARIMLVIFLGIITLFLVLASVIRPLIMKVREKLDELNNALQENLAGAKLIRAFGRRGSELTRFRDRNDEYLAISLRAGYIMAMAFPFLFLLGQLALVAVSWLGGLSVIDANTTGIADGISLGQLVAFNEYAMLAMWPILALGMTLQFMARAAASAVRITEILDEEPAVREPATPRAFLPGDSSVEFRGVSFHYGKGEPAIDDVSFRIETGETVGIIGRTGSGKSTLAALIPRYYDATAGGILVGGLPVDASSLGDLRRKALVVLQEAVLLSGTIEENVAYSLGRIPLTPKERERRLQAALRTASGDDILETRTEGWQSTVGERGTGLSGGQRQRIAIARAIAAQPDILILDDVTSALDGATERRIVESLFRECADTTLIIISQKVHTVRQAHRILVMEEGRIIGDGTHEQLLQDNAVYRQIAETQRMELHA